MIQNLLTSSMAHVWLPQRRMEACLRCFCRSEIKAACTQLRSALFACSRTLHIYNCLVTHISMTLIYSVREQHQQRQQARLEGYEKEVMFKQEKMS